MTNTPPTSNDSAASIVFDNQAQSLRRNSLHHVHMPSHNTFEQWSLRERGVARNRRNHPLPSMTAQFPPMFPRLNPFHDSELLLPPPASSSSSSSILSTRNPTSRKRLVGILEEALEISNGIVLENTKNDVHDVSKDWLEQHK